ncbi:MAG TPA: glycoside hydrolase family 2 protein [Candidatus Acidoferrales bacterium]|nr:glycoside hydrolase family 2 protein [Candidatus Acidoferrales bacterium]
MKISRLCVAAIVFAIFAPSLVRAQTDPFPGAKFSLSPGWQLQSSCLINATGPQISMTGFQATGWHSTSVPATVVAALVADGTYPDPDFGMNLRKIPGTQYPIGANFANLPMPKDSPFVCSWWYRKEFRLPRGFDGRTVWLHLDGVNYRANIWLNGKKFASAKDVSGSYRIYDFDVTPFVKPGETNVIAVEAFAPTENDLAMNWVDWNPTPPDKDMGLWGDVYLAATGAVAVRHPQVVTHFTDASLDEADLTVRAEVQNASGAPVSAVLQGEISGASAAIHFEQPLDLKPGEIRSVTFTPAQFPHLHITHPKIWWPYGLGPQNLHTLTMRASAEGKVSDEQHIRFGIREITSELTDHNRLLFHINGKNILIRGGGWSPDMLMRESHQRLEAQFDYVREMGLNTIRLEGKLEPDDFFDLADERGVLVMAGWCCCSFWEQWKKWQPSDLENATAQLRSQILRLRSHPSLLVWLNGSDNPPPADVERAYIGVLQQTNWPNPYISSASQQETSVTGPSGVKMLGPYDYVPPEYWLEDTKRGGAYGFNTETSPGPAPVVEDSLKKMMPADQIWPPNECWHFHGAGGRYQRLSAFNDAMTQMYGAPKNLADYERKSQAMAYEGERAMFEAYARNKYGSTGVIQWMLNNAWPSLFWHLYDYYLQPAGGYFGAKKANELLHVQYSYDDRSVVVVNSFYRAFPELTVSAKVYTFDMKPVFSRRSVINVPADFSARAYNIPLFPRTATPQAYFVKLDLHDRAGKLLSSNFYWLSNKPTIFDWNSSNDQRTEVSSYPDFTMLADLPRVRLEATANRETAAVDSGFSVRLRNPSAHLAFQVRLAVTKKSGDEILPVFWSDNYFELLPGETRTLTARYPAGTKLAQGARLEVGGWNVEPVTLVISPSHIEPAKPAGVIR